MGSIVDTYANDCFLVNLFLVTSFKCVCTLIDTIYQWAIPLLRSGEGTSTLDPSHNIIIHYEWIKVFQCPPTVEVFLHLPDLTANGMVPVSYILFQKFQIKQWFRWLKKKVVGYKKLIILDFERNLHWLFIYLFFLISI